MMRILVLPAGRSLAPSIGGLVQGCVGHLFQGRSASG